MFDFNRICGQLMRERELSSSSVKFSSRVDFLGVCAFQSMHERAVSLAIAVNSVVLLFFAAAPGRNSDISSAVSCAKGKLQ